LLAAVLAVGSLVAPATALAARHHASHKAAPSYPMKADEYRALIEKRIDGVRAAIDKKLDRRGVSPERKKAIHKTIDESAQELRAEVARATADGVVTQSEADKIKPIATGLRAKVRERLRAEKSPGSSKESKEKSEKVGKGPAGKKEKGSKDDATTKHALDKTEHEKKGGSTKSSKSSKPDEKHGKGSKSEKDAKGSGKPAKKPAAPDPGGSENL
jgi:hypothetical protein